MEFDLYQVLATETRDTTEDSYLDEKMLPKRRRCSTPLVIAAPKSHPTAASLMVCVRLLLCLGLNKSHVAEISLKIAGKIITSSGIYEYSLKAEKEKKQWRLWILDSSSK